MAANKHGETLPGHAAEDKHTQALLPPSEFEKPVARDVYRTAHKHPVHSKYVQEQLHNNVVPLCAHPNKDYEDELIQRQAGEIAELRSEVMMCRLAYEQDAADWKARLSLLMEEHEADVRLLQKNLANVAEERDIKVSRLSRELDQTCTDRQAETAALREELESTQLSLGKRVHDLEEELRSLQHDSDRRRHQLEEEMREKSQVLEEQAQQISSLKSYICDTQQTHKLALACKMQKEAVDNKLKIAEAENHKLTSTLELVEVRFQALQEILSIQEQQLGKTKVAGKAKQASSLLTRWREKVFSLLVQQLMSDILHKGDIHGLQLKIHGLEDELIASEAQVQVLQHSLTDKLAQLHMELNNNQRLQEDCEHKQQVAVCLDEQSKRDCLSVELLSQFVHRTQKQMDKVMEVLEEKSIDLKMCGQRVNFANKRMELIKSKAAPMLAAVSHLLVSSSLNFLSLHPSEGHLSCHVAAPQLARKSALASAVAREPEPPGDRGDSRSGVRDNEKLVYQELQKVTQERDSLAAQVRADTEHWSTVVAEIKSQYTGEMRSLKEQLDVLQQGLEHSSQECRDLTVEVADLKEDVREKEDKIKQLQTELCRHERGIDSVLTDQRLNFELRCRDQLADLERKLNSAKREHAKTVVSMRQMEQSHQRRLQQGADLLRATEQHLRKQIEELELRLRSVDKEKNLMMTTLRQEGLLRSDRGQFVYLSDEEGNCSRNMLQDGGGESQIISLDKDVPGHPPSSSSCIMKPNFQHEPVHLLLEDLKSLTAAVFDDEEVEEVEETKEYNT